MKENVKRVIFFSEFDLSRKDYLSEVETILNNLKKPQTLIDAIELYHVKKFIEAGVFTKYWKNNTPDFYRETAQEIPKIVGLFFFEHQTQMPSMYKQINISAYRTTFWEILIESNFIIKWNDTNIISIFQQENWFR